MALTPEHLQQLGQMFPNADFEEVPEGIKVVPREGSPESNRVLLHEKVEQAIGRIETDAADEATWLALVPTRRAETTRIAVLVVAKLARLVLGRLEKS